VGANIAGTETGGPTAAALANAVAAFAFDGHAAAGAEETASAEPRFGVGLDALGVGRHAATAAVSSLLLVLVLG
jgi:hypothetical protein